MTKTIKTLIKDIHHVLETGEGWTDEISQWVADDISKSLSRQFNSIGQERKRTLRPSSLGTPCERKLWYSINSRIDPEPISPSTRNKFIFGDITESYLLGLCKAAGHSVVGLQTIVDIDGIRGARDCIIDGMLVDVKSASSRSYEKFKRNQLRRDDPFGYLSQISSYLYGSRNDPLLTEKDKVGFLAFDKQFGHICFDVYDVSDLVAKKSEEVAHKRKVVKQDKPPERPKWPRYEYDRKTKEYVLAEVAEDWAEGKSGNRKLSTQCSYCDYKKECWPNLRTFLYANGPKYLTKVVNEPRAFEEGKEGF